MGFYQDWAKEKGIKEPPKKKSGLASLLPTGGGIGGALGGAAAGAALGSVVPIVGTGIGGLIGAVLGGGGGSALGKYAENNIDDVEDKSQGVLKEGIIGGLTSLPITSAGKVLKGSAQLTKAALTGGSKSVAKRALTEAGAEAIPRAAKGLQGKVATELAESGASKAATRTGILNKVTQAAKEADAKVSGIGTGKTINGRVITPKRSDELLEFARSKGVNSGTPIEQARQSQQLFDDTTNALDSTLTSINRGLKKTESDSIAKSITKSMTAAKGVGKEFNADTAKFISDIKGAKDLKGLESLRREADDLAFTARGAGKTVAAKQAQIVRDSIDSFITPLSKDYKAIKGDYSKAKDLLELSSKNANTGGGIEVFGNKIGSQIVPGAVSKATGVLSKVGRDTPQFVDTAARTLAEGTRGAGILGAIGRESLLGQRSDMASQDPELTEEPTTAIGTETTDQATQSADQPNVFGQDGIQNLILQDLQGNGGKNVANLLKLYETFGKPVSEEKSKLTSVQATRAAAAQNALNDIPLLEDSITSGKLGAAKAIPGSSSAIGRRLLGTEDLDAALFNIADNILRARSGAAAPEEEVKRFVNTFLPGPLDSEESKRSKLDRAVRELYGYINPTAASEGADVEQLMAQGAS